MSSSLRRATPPPYTASEQRWPTERSPDAPEKRPSADQESSSRRTWDAPHNPRDVTSLAQVHTGYVTIRHHIAVNGSPTRDLGNCSQGQVTEQPSLGGMTDALHKTRTAISFPNSEKRHEREQSRGRQPDGDGDGDRDNILMERHDMRDEQTSEGARPWDRPACPLRLR